MTQVIPGAYVELAANKTVGLRIPTYEYVQARTIRLSVNTNTVRGKVDIYTAVATVPTQKIDDGGESSGPARELRVVHVELSK